jgi:hypothetical protein
MTTPRLSRVSQVVDVVRIVASCSGERLKERLKGLVRRRGRVTADKVGASTHYHLQIQNSAGQWRVFRLSWTLFGAGRGRSQGLADATTALCADSCGARGSSESYLAERRPARDREQLGDLRKEMAGYGLVLVPSSSHRNVAQDEP